jgi:hypothetical protein
MDLASIYYLGVTLLMFLVFAALVTRTCSRKRRERGEAPKYRMMEEDELRSRGRAPRG